MMQHISRVRNAASRKMRSSCGESMAEVLIAMLIACMATVALVAMTLSASSSSAKTREAYQNVCNQQTAVALSTSDTAGTAGAVSAELGAGSITISVGSVAKTLTTQLYKTEDFSYYVVSDADKATSSQTVSDEQGDEGSQNGGA